MWIDIFSWFLQTPSFYSVAWLSMFFLCFAFFLHKKPNSFVTVFFEMMYELAYDFFIDILWKNEKRNIVLYVLVLFFLILFINFFGILLEFLAPIVWLDANGNFILERYIQTASADINFNIAMAIISICIIVYVQFSSLWLKRFFTNYFPVFGKKYLEVERWDSPYFIYILKYIPIKIGDIAISMFLWLLDLIGLGAKIISLAFRLFWNITSGTVLLAISVAGLSAWSESLIGFSFPILLPVVIYAQEILIACIQALVFSLLVAIFIKVARNT